MSSQVNSEHKPSTILSFLRRAQEFTVLAYAISLPISLTLTWIVFIVGLVLSLLEFLASFSAAPDRDGRSLAVPPLTIPLLLFALAVALSCVFNSGDLPGTVGSAALKEAWKGLYSLKNILPYFWAANVVGRNRDLGRSALALLLWTSAIAGVYSAIQQIFDFHPGTFKYLQGTGFHGHPMAFAGQMQIFSLFSLALLLSGGFKKLVVLPAVRQLRTFLEFTQRTPVFVIIVLCNFVGLFFAGERSAWLGGFVGVLALAGAVSWQLIVPALALMFAAGIFAWFFIPLLRTRISSLFSGKDVSISARLVIWKACLEEHFPKSPCFGVGWLKFPHFDIKEAIVPGVSKDLNHGHSNYIHILTTTGIFGLVSYVNLLLWIAVCALKKLHRAVSARDHFQAGIAIAIFASNVALASSGIFEFNFGTAQVRLAQWFLFALL
ncbi:MAG: O-antigen ligase family protein [Candidatus Obscuribacterales bacterium]|jgi:O-antigen ligase|nr:O-antigen ligase family protein [Candidatus Obscuribacterales bacterium]